MIVMPIAPEMPDLPDIDAELAAIAAHHDLVPDPPLTGYVTAGDVAHETNKHTCDVIIFMCHGDDAGLVLSDGHVAVDLVVQFVKSSQASLCVLNACWSERLARRVFVHCRIDVIYARLKVEDKAAALYMVTLSDALATAGSYAEAYQMSGSQGGMYKLLSISEVSMRPDLKNSPRTDDLPGYILDRFTQFSLDLRFLAQKQSEDTSKLTEAIRSLHDDFERRELSLKENNVVTREMIRTLQQSTEAYKEQAQTTKEHVDAMRSARSLTHGQANMIITLLAVIAILAMIIFYRVQGG